MLDSKYGLVNNCEQIQVKYQSWWLRDLMKICREGGGEGWFQDHVEWKLGWGR